MSADDLENSLVVSPQLHDHDVFKTRAQCDLVVYYDQSTPDTSYLHPPSRSPDGKALRILHAALHDYNYSKPLKQPPLLLGGGLDAWIDIFGLQSLKVEAAMPVATAAPVLNLHRRSQQVARAPTPLLLERRAANSQIHPPPYPASPYDSSQSASLPMPIEPIDLEEEAKWMERLRKERDPVSLTDGEDGIKRRGTAVMPNNTGGSTYVRTVEEFVSDPTWV
jgi:ubiquitin carboxyl-terminal hydrolase 8